MPPEYPNYISSRQSGKSILGQEIHASWQDETFDPEESERALEQAFEDALSQKIQYLTPEQMKLLRDSLRGPKGDKGDRGEKGKVGLMGPPGPMGYTGPAGEDGKSRLALPPGNYDAEMVNEWIRRGDHSGVTLAEGTVIVGGEPTGTVKITPSTFKPIGGKPGKQPEDHKNKKKPPPKDPLYDDINANVDRLVTVVEQWVKRCQVLELQVDQLTRDNDALLKQMSEMDDRVNWLET